MPPTSSSGMRKAGRTKVATTTKSNSASSKSSPNKARTSSSSTSKHRSPSSSKQVKKPKKKQHQKHNSSSSAAMRQAAQSAQLMQQQEQQRRLQVLQQHLQQQFQGQFQAQQNFPQWIDPFNMNPSISYNHNNGLPVMPNNSGRNQDVIVLDGSDDETATTDAEAVRQRTPQNEQETRLLLEVQRTHRHYSASVILETIRRMVEQNQEPEQKQQQNPNPSQPQQAAAAPSIPHAATALSAQQVIQEIQNDMYQVAMAKQEDAARALSEQEHQQELERQRENRKRQLEQVQSWDECRSIFSQSWILHGDTVGAAAGSSTKDSQLGATGLPEMFGRNVTQIRPHLVELLKLEEGARKWYDATLTRPYFVNAVIPELCTAAGSGDVPTIVRFLKEKVEYIRKSMYSLNEQQGGVPRLFLEAYESAKKISGEEDEVQVVDTLPKEKAKAVSRQATKSNSKDEVLEIS